MKIHYKNIYILAAALLFALNIKAQTSVFTPANVSSVTCSAPIVYGTISRWNDGNTTVDADATFPASDSILVTFKLKQAFKVVSYKLDFYYTNSSYTSKSIRLSGSNDGVTWKSLDNKTVNAYPFSSSFSNTATYTYYQFSFKGHINNELWLNEITGYNDQLSAPALTATPGTTGNIVNLSWNQALVGTGNLFIYELQRSTDGVNFSPAAMINAPGTTYTDTTLTQSTAYYYRIRSRKDTAFSAYSSIVKVTTISDALTTAPVLTATPRSGYNISLSWNAIVKTKGSYEVSRSANNHEFTVLKTLDKAVTTYTDVIADSTVTYWYKVRGINYASNSPYSNTVEVTDSLKRQPTLTATPGTVGTQANLSWSLAINTPGTFALERSTNGTDFTLLKTFDKSITTYTDATLTNATAYWYRVKGVNFVGSSPYSAIAKVTTLKDTLKNTPVLTATATTGTRTQLSWSLVFNTPTPGGFELEQSTDGTNFTLFGKFDKAVTSYTMESLTPNTSYWFRIRGYNYNSKSPYSAIVQITTTNNVPLPGDITDDGGKLYVSAENSNGANGSEGSVRLIDNNTGTKWLVFTGQASGDLAAIYKPTGAYVVSSYTLTTAGDMPPRDPKTWTFAGSADSVNWVTLDTRTNQFGGTTARGATFSYTIPTPGTVTFKFYRTLFTANNGATDGVRFQVAEWQIFGVNPDIPALPTNLQVTGTTASTISLSWNEGAAKPVSHFILQRSADGIYFNTVATPPASPFTYTDTNLLDSATYYYRIQAIGASSPTANAGWSNVAKGLTGFNTTGIPFIPGNLAVTSITDTIVNLSWTDRSNNETGFKLERSRDSVTFVQIKDVAANTVTVSDSTVFPGNVFYYRIRSYNSKGASVYSNIVKVTTTGLNSAPLASTPFIYRKICNGAGTYNTTFSGIVPGPHYESSQTMQVTSVTSDTASAKFFSGFNFNPTINNGTVHYGFKTTGLATVKDSASIFVTVKDNGGLLNGGLDSAVFAIKIYFVPFTIAITADKPVTSVPRYTLVNLTASSSAPENTTYVWNNADGIEGAKNLLVLQVRPVKTTTYTVTGTTTEGCQATTHITVAPQDSMVVANALTPNGDGKNDKWVVWGIEKNQNNSVKVIDRAGTTVFQKKNYANDWDGSYNGALLPEGAYYYVIDAGDGSKPQRGMLTIVRDQK